VPTVAASVPGYEGSAWAGIGAPKNTLVEIVNIHLRSYPGVGETEIYFFIELVSESTFATTRTFPTRRGM
jgi:hypothetical protein